MRKGEKDIKINLKDLKVLV